jgi:hypothetical protein
MKDFIDVGSSPHGEDCAQVGSDDYHDRARRECRAYIAQLRRVFGDEPEGARLSVKSNPHDFGTYLSVICYYDDQIPAAADYAFRCESESPEHWDTQARQELAGERK